MKRNTQRNSMDEENENFVSLKSKDAQDSAKDKINLDYDWNTEYGDGDIPDIDK